ncbi:MAG: cytochrome-c peroxidase [Candidatus Obscuribacterales bacterium]|nr:cytochrome-c peroxidase [Candidatus Obscuribacterales bacterium]
MSKKTIWLLTAFSAIVLLLLSIPIANLLLQRTYPAPSDDPEFKAVSDIMMKKCADCHTPDLTQYPLYFNLPFAKDVINEDIRIAQSAFLLTQAKLAGREKFGAADMAMLSSAMAKQNMPPLRYIALHWDAGLSDKEQKLLVGWIQKRAKEFDIRAIPEENFFKPDHAKAALGEKLFNDKRLSGDKTISCASCHGLDKGGSDQMQFATGIRGQKGIINTPTVFNAAYNFVQFWDGRAKDLKAQVAGPLKNPLEMDSDWPQVMANLAADSEYQKQFRALYADGISAESISDAISEYEHTLLTPGSRFDKYLGGDLKALTDDEKAGFELFKKHECASCHAGPALGGLSYEKMGVKKDYFKDRGDIKDVDYGRFNVTHSLADKFRFKVPTLRNIEFTYPYFHDGSARTLEQAVKIMSEYQLDKALSPSEIKQVSAFLRSLSGNLNAKPLSGSKSP